MWQYSCNMTTIKNHTETVAAIAAATPSRETFADLPPITIELRMELSHAAMNVLLGIPEDTQEAVASALKEADGLAVAGTLAERQWAVQRPELFQSNPILKAAGDLIRARGWTKGAYEGARGELCAIGAIRVATRGDAWGFEDGLDAEVSAVQVLLDRIADAFGPGLSVPGWNDRQTSAEGVLKLLF